MRRLYDIANVLTSLNLIKKVHVREERGRKPAFKWLGPVEFDHSANAGKSQRRAVTDRRQHHQQMRLSVLLPRSLSNYHLAGNTVNVAAVLPAAAQPMADQDFRKTKMVRHASFNIATTSVALKRQVNSAPCSPRLEAAGKERRVCASPGSDVFRALPDIFFPSHHSSAKPACGLLQKDKQRHGLPTAVWKRHRVSSHDHARDLSAATDHCLTPKQCCHDEDSHPLPVTT